MKLRLERVITVVLILAILTLSLAGAGCDKKGKQGAAIALADTTAGLTAWSDATQVLVDLAEIEPAGAIASLDANDRTRQAVSQISDRVQQGYSSKEILPIIDQAIDDLRKAEADGLLGIKNPDAQQKFQEITAFAQFGLHTAENIIKAIKPPPLPNPVKVQASLEKQPESFAFGEVSDVEKWTQFVTIGQDFAFAVIRHNQLDTEQAFAAQVELNAKLKDTNAQRLAALRSLH